MEVDGHMYGLCPSVTLSCPNKTVDLSTGQTVASCAAIIAGSLSCFGALLILYTYFAFKDLRTSAQTVITLLAVADLIYSLLFILSSVSYFVFRGETDWDKCQVYDSICTILAYATVWAAWSVFIWNSVLALHFCLLMFHRVTLSSKLFPVYNIIGWGLPIGVALPMLVLGKVGKEPGEPEPVCFVRVTSHDSEVDVALLLGFAQWFVEVVSYFFVVILYGIIIVRMCRKRLQGHISRSAMHKVERRLMLIPFFYLATRIWDSLFFALAVTDATSPCTLSPTDKSLYYDATNVLEIIGSGGQGFMNAILYIFASKEMQKRLFVRPWRRLLAKVRTQSREQQHVQSERQRLVRRQTVPIRPHLAIQTGNQQSQSDHRSSTYFSFPTDLPTTDAVERTRDGELSHSQNQVSLCSNKEMQSLPKVVWSTTYLSLTSESFSVWQNSDRLNTSNTHFSVSSEFPSERTTARTLETHEPEPEPEVPTLHASTS